MPAPEKKYRYPKTGIKELCDNLCVSERPCKYTLLFSGTSCLGRGSCTNGPSCAVTRFHLIAPFRLFHSIMNTLNWSKAGPGYKLRAGPTANKGEKQPGMAKRATGGGANQIRSDQFHVNRSSLTCFWDNSLWTTVQGHPRTQHTIFMPLDDPEGGEKSGSWCDCRGEAAWPDHLQRIRYVCC